MEKKRETFDFKKDLASLYPDLMRRAGWRWPSRYWGEYSPEDLTSQTICNVLESQQAFRGTTVAELTQYARTTLDRLIFNHAREIEGRRRRHEPFRSSEHMPPKRGTSPSGKLMKKEAAEKLADALDSLPPEQREIWTRIEDDQGSYEEVSRATHKPAYTLYRLIRKARSSLRRLLGREYASHS